MRQFTLAALAVIGLAGAAWGQTIPEKIGFQGRLTNASGNPVDGTVNLTFTLYDAAEGGATVWTETQSNVPVFGGLYSVSLGDVTGLDSTAFDKPYWLGVKVGEDTEMAPLYRLTASPYAFMAKNADTLDGQHATDFASSSHNHDSAYSLLSHNHDSAYSLLGHNHDAAYWKLGGNAVGTTGAIGTTDNQPLNVIANSVRALRLEPHATSPNLIGGYFENFANGGICGVVIAGGGQAGSVNQAWAAFDSIGGGLGNVAGAFASTVGGGGWNHTDGDYATVPGGLGNTALGAFSFAAGRRAQANHAGSFVWADSTDADWGSTANNQFLIRASGNVGIGTTTPGARLDVVGNVRAGTTTPNAMMGTHPIYGNQFAGWWKDGCEYTLMSDDTNTFINAPSSSGNIYLRNQASAGPSPHTTEIMTLLSDGRVGIGTVTPNSGYRLEVDAGNLNGVYSHAEGTGVYGGSSSGFGVDGSGTTGVRGASSSTSGRGVQGHTTSYSGTTYGVHGISNSSAGYGVYGQSNVGVCGYGITYGVHGTSISTSGYGVYGVASADTGTNYGVYGRSNSATGYGGFFAGNVYVSGSITCTGTKPFTIDHPLDPANKVLRHFAAESPEVLNMYNGNVLLDDKGEAVVTLPEWMSVLNRDFRYQLTCIGGFAPVYVAEKITSNRFKIAGGKPGLEISWLVTGVRQDPAALFRCPAVEEMKSVQNRGKYYCPEAYGKPREEGIGYIALPKPVETSKQ